MSLPQDPIPTTPTHFVSSASKRLTELQLQLNLTSESSSSSFRPPTELDPLLPDLSAHPSSYCDTTPCQPIPTTTTPTTPTTTNTPTNPNAAFRYSPAHQRRKMGTFDGVYLPTILSIFNVIYFLRFGYCLGQIGLLATVILLLIAYVINTLTVFSLSAIATNGQVRGGGAYYLISRTLGPEFGGSIGILFCLCQAFTAGMNIIGFVECLVWINGFKIGSDLPNRDTRLNLITTTTSTIIHGTSPSPTIKYLMKSCALFIGTISCIALGRNKIFTNMTRSMATVLLLTVLAILVSFFKKFPFEDPSHDFIYTGFSWETFQQNLYPSYDIGSGRGIHQPRFSDYQTVFGIIFPSVSGILAGSSLSGDLRKPSRSLPKGVLTGLMSVMMVYLISLFCLSLSCQRNGFNFLDTGHGYYNLIVYQISQFPTLISLGLLLITMFSCVMGITVSGKILQAISRDGLIPILKPFFSQGSQIGDDPVYSILFCYLICQVSLMYTINKLAIHITTISLLIFACINLACFTLRIAGSPNFRPSFRLFSEWTALLGLVLAFVSMYAVDPVSASTSLIVMMVLFTVIHYSSPAKQWGEVTQSIIYHQVRKYLLRLDERKDNVKYWRPQVLLFTNDPRHDWNQIVFCNSLKKGGLYVLAHIIKSEFSSESIRELQEQQLNWLSLVDISNIKAFVDITLAPDERVGARHLLLTSGLGGMRPNICMLGFPTNLKWRRRGRLLHVNPEDEEAEGRDEGAESDRSRGKQTKLMKRRSDSSMTVKGFVIDTAAEVKIDCLGSLPTDSQRSETPIKPVDFVGIIEDSLSLNKSVGLTFGFEKLRLPDSISRPQHSDSGNKFPLSASLGGLASSSLGGLASSSLGGLASSSLGGLAGTGLSSSGNQNLEEDEAHRTQRRWIDLWPILRDGESGWETYTMVLQLGTILSMVPTWRKQHNLRVTIFCEHEDEISEERKRMEKLLNDLRIRASLRVCVLGSGEIQTYECLVKGKEVDVVTWSLLENALGGDPWWETLKFMRAQDGPIVGRSTDPIHQPSLTSENKRSTSEGNLAKSNKKPVDRSLLTKNSQTNNIRIKALHPFSRRPPYDSRRSFDSETGTLKSSTGDDDDEDELILEENDGDDDTIARAAYKKRITKPNTTSIFQGLPDEPSTPRLGNGSTSSTRQLPSPEYGSILGDDSLDLQNLTLSPKELCWAQPTHTNSFRQSSSTNVKSPAAFKKISNRTRPTRPSPKFPRRVSQQTVIEEPVGDDSHHTQTSPVVELDFNSLPMRAQLVCLNELIKVHSKDDTTLIFTSLPPPESGCSKSYESSSRYLDEIECFLDNLPPVLAIYAKQFTVTASL